MQKNTTTIMIPAGAVYSVAGMMARARVAFSATVDTAHTYHGAVVGYSFARGEMPCYIEAAHVQAPDPEPTSPEPPTRQPRQSREAQYNQRVQVAYNTLRETANRDGQANHRAFSVASQSQPGGHHIVTWDTDTDHTHCDCTAGQYGSDCVHQAAMRRYIAGIHAADARRADEAARVRQAAADRARDTSILRRDNRPFDLMR